MSNYNLPTIEFLQVCQSQPNHITLVLHRCQEQCNRKKLACLGNLPIALRRLTKWAGHECHSPVRQTNKCLANTASRYSMWNRMRSVSCFVQQMFQCAWHCVCL